MKGLVKSIGIIGKVLGVIMGDNVTTASEDTLRQYPYLWFGA